MTFKKLFVYILFFILLPAGLLAQDTVKVMTYNLLNYSTDTSRHGYYRTIIRNSKPDVLVVEEIHSQAAVDAFLANVMNLTGNTYVAGTFIDGPDTDNAIFVKQSKFKFLSNRAITTDLRDINEFKVLHKNHLSDTLYIYGAHLKASTGSANETGRALEIDSLRKVTNKLPLGSSYIFLGDCNIYKSTEQAYIKLLAVNPDNRGHFIDPIPNMTGTWNNASYAPYHTQSPRVRQFGGGSNGGMDDRFDLLIFSPAINSGGHIKYVPNSLTPYGNDGNHFNDSINKRPNTAVADSIADAIHYASDHIPVYASFIFNGSSLVGITGEGTEVPRNFTLYQNYPNPFNPETKIDYSLPVQSKVVITISDIKGRKVLELENEIQTAGFHSAVFNASSFASGTYFYKLEASSGDLYFTKTLKMLFVK